MATEAELDILAAGIVCAAGFSSRQVFACCRAGLAQVRKSYLFDRLGEPLSMGLVPLDELPALAGQIDRLAIDRREERLLRIAAPALVEACAPVRSRGARVPVVLAVREPSPAGTQALPEGFLDRLVCQAGVPLDLDRCDVLAGGRSAGVLALRRAREWLAAGAEHVLVGGLDSYLEPERLAALEGAGRLAAGVLHDGFIPGEGAAFLLLAAAGSAAHAQSPPLARIVGAGEGSELGHIEAPDIPHRAEGTFAACQAAIGAAGRATIRTVLAGFNGESFWAKEWGVCRIRLAPAFEEPVRMEHPVEIMGDTGAALGPTLLALAAVGLSHGVYAGDCLVWCGSDGPERAAAVLRT